MSGLLAKSPKSGKWELGGHGLVQHTLMVMRAGAALCDVVGREALRAFGKSPDRFDELKRLVVAAAWAHDLGKCSSHFQAMLVGSREPQARRHELLSALILTREPLGEWFRDAFPDARERVCVLSAAVSHHRKYPRAPGTSKGLHLLMGPRLNFMGVVKLAWSKFGFTNASLNNHLLRDVYMTEEMLEDEEVDLRRVLREGEGHDLHAIVRTLTICADVLGSSQADDVVHKNRDISLELQRMMSRRISSDDVSQMITRHWWMPKPFQEAAGASTAPVTLVRAGCGSGKTMAALLWTRQHAKDGKQLWFTYPTMGTASEGFAGYGVGTDLSFRAALEHSRWSSDVDHLTEKLGEAAVLGTGNDDADLVERSDSLRLLGEAVVFSTADVPLGWLMLNRKGTYAAPAIVDSAIVFDEIHSYDDRMFGVLLRWLVLLPGIPVLLMTASLSEYRLKLLQEAVFKAHGRDMPVIEGPEELEVAPRYELLGDSDDGEHAAWLSDRYEFARSDAVSLILEAVSAGRRVLWVSNTVSRCVETAEKIRDALGGAAPVYVYHSRFKYQDRVWRHDSVMRAFERGAGPCVVCATQVAEMSLDLDADLLVTDLAPVPSLIQRLGRLNRRDVPSSTRPFVVLDGGEGWHLPYAEEEMAKARLWLLDLGAGRPVSRRDLSRSWARVQGPERGIPVDLPVVLENPDRAEPDSLREESATIRVILAQDTLREDYEDFVIPMNMSRRAVEVLSTARRHRHVPVVTNADLSYSAEDGARWRP